MNRLKNGIAATLLILPLFSCASYNAYQKAQGAEKQKDWDNAVSQYEKALEIDPDNMRYRIARDRAKLESSRIHFEKGKTLLASAYQKAQGAEKQKDWDNAVSQYEKALEIDPDNMRYRIARDRAKLESSRIHFEKGKTLLA